MVYPSRIGRRTSFSPSCGPDPRKNWTAFLTDSESGGSGNRTRDGVVITVLQILSLTHFPLWHPSAL